MAATYRDTTKNARLDQVTTDVGAAGFLQVWDGAVPAAPDSAPAGTLLASLALSNPIAPAAVAGVLTLSGITSDTDANATGTPTFARLATTETGTTTGVAQITAGVGSGDLNFDASIVAAGTVAVSSLTITHA